MRRSYYDWAFLLFSLNLCCLVAARRQFGCSNKLDRRAGGTTVRVWGPPFSAYVGVVGLVTFALYVRTYACMTLCHSFFKNSVDNECMRMHHPSTIFLPCVLLYCGLRHGWGGKALRYAKTQAHASVFGVPSGGWLISSSSSSNANLAWCTNLVYEGS